MTQKISVVIISTLYRWNYPTSLAKVSNIFFEIRLQEAVPNNKKKNMTVLLAVSAAAAAAALDRDGGIDRTNKYRRKIVIPDIL